MGLTRDLEAEPSSMARRELCKNIDHCFEPYVPIVSNKLRYLPVIDWMNSTNDGFAIGMVEFSMDRHVRRQGKGTESQSDGRTPCAARRAAMGSMSSAVATAS